FEPFQRLHGKDEYEGTGIGLSVCRTIVERHGGHIEAKSSPGEGTCFIVTLRSGADSIAAGNATRAP
ncbi:MAG: ATP-binding protein, partial [Blastocatellia bacterium]